MNIGQNIRRVRKSKGFTQVKLAEIAGINATSLSHIERGRGVNSISLLQKIANALDTPLHKLMIGNWSEDVEGIPSVEEIEEALIVNCERVNEAARNNDLRRNLICFGRASILCELLNAYGDGAVELVDAWENCYEVIKGINMDGEFSPVAGGDWFD